MATSYYVLTYIYMNPMVTMDFVNVSMVTSYIDGFTVSGIKSRSRSREERASIVPGPIGPIVASRNRLSPQV